jgi:hypothetical protein
MTTKKPSKLLVVDASVAHSAGKAQNPMSSCCRDTLLAILMICHRIVMTEAIQEEWHRHTRTFSRKWLVSMYARKQVHRCEAIQLSHVDEACEGLSVAEQDGLRKDLCLIEAACVGDGIIVTRDEVIQAIWDKCHDRLGVPSPITWINPVNDGVHALEHL